MPFDGVGFLPDDRLQKLEAVIDLIDAPEKWCKGALRSFDGRRCLRGALRAVPGAELLEPSILQAIGDLAGKRFRRIEAFNDHPSTNHAQIVAVLSRVRDELSAAGNGGGSTPASVRALLCHWLRRR